jgi:RNA polymerase sigma factor (sigma-70 family)
MDASVLPSHPASVRRSRAALVLASDKRLVTLVRAGEPVAFEVLYDRHARKLLSFCRHMLGSRQDGEDAVQRTFASAYRALLVDEREIELRPWLFSIARNESLSILRQRRLTSELDDAEPATEGLSSRVEGREDLRDLLADLRALPERQRAALLLSELGGFTHAQIADAVGARPEQIKAYVFQARSHLIAERDARERSCVEVRAQLANTRGAALLRRELSRHLSRCRVCRSYSAALRRQRRTLAIVLPVTPSLALRSAVLKGALGNTHGAGAGTGIAGAGLVLTNGGGNVMLAKGLAAIVFAGLGAGAGTLALHAPSSNHLRAEAAPPVFAGSDQIHLRAQHQLAPLRSPLSPSPPSRLSGTVVLPPAQAHAPPRGASGPLAARGTGASTPTRTWSERRNAPEADSQDSAVGDPAQPVLVPSSVSATQREPTSSSNAGRAERTAASENGAQPGAGGRGGSKSASPSTGRAAGSSGVAHSSDFTPPGHAHAEESSNFAPPGQANAEEPSDFTPPGHETGTGNGGSDTSGNSASAPGHNR